jgi:MoxR-like ATPase
MRLSLDAIHDRSHEILDEVEKAIVGKRDVLELVLMGILAEGHILLEDYPGLAKTLVARSFADAIGIDFNRVQFTPDLLPADITGSSIYDQRNGRFDFRKGPVFTNLLLGDEINRAPPKTQAALLEAMQEGQVSAEGVTYPLDPPFVVIATENPIEYEGTYPLPEAQLDRFMLRIGIGYPDRDGEWEILKRRIERRHDQLKLHSVVDGPTLLEMQQGIEQVFLGESVGYYIVDLVTATRDSSEVQVGASPRGALALLKLSRCRAVLKGRDFVTPDDVKRMALPALRHRIQPSPELELEGRDTDAILKGLLEKVEAPRK